MSNGEGPLHICCARDCRKHSTRNLSRAMRSGSMRLFRSGRFSTAYKIQDILHGVGPVTVANVLTGTAAVRKAFCETVLARLWTGENRKRYWVCRATFGGISAQRFPGGFLVSNEDGFGHSCSISYVPKLPQYRLDGVRESVYCRCHT